MRVLASIACVLTVVAAGCGSPPPGNADMGTGPVDTGPRPDTPGHDSYVGPAVDTGPGATCSSSAMCPGSYCNGGSHTCCVPTSPPFEICGDHIDQNCDMHDEACGDNDMDNFQACRPPVPPATTVDFSTCDCDDTDPMTFPASGSIPGGQETCDGKDNDCDGVIDESAACCTSCMALPSTNQADTCMGGGPSGTCSCSTNAGGAPCPTGQSCCSSGCVDTTTSFMNCGFCEAACTPNADTCSGGQCHCGTGPVCQFINMCHGGACM